MGVWRIINRSYLKYASSRVTRSYSQASLASSFNFAAKQSKTCSSYNPNSDMCRKPHSAFGSVRFFASILEKIKEEDAGTDGPILNEQITASFVRLVTEDGHSVVPRSEALRRAKEQNLDLVEVQKDAKPPVCKIMDYTREKYIKATKEKERAKAKRSEGTLRPGLKEVIFNPKIQTKDLKFKAEQAIKLMERGYRVKCSAEEENKKASVPENLVELLSRFIPFIEDSVVDSGPHLERDQAYVIVRHSKFSASKKGGCKKLKDIDVHAALRAPAPRIDATKVARKEAKEKETAGADVDKAFDFVNSTGKPEFNSSSRREETGPGININQNQPVEGQNRYARNEPSDQFSAGRPAGGEANRYASRSPANPQHSQPRFPNQDPNQQSAGFPSRSSNQNQNRQPSQPQFPNQNQNRQPSQPQPQPQPLNRYSNKKPAGFQPRSPPNQTQNPPPPQPGSPSQGPNQQPTGPGRSSGPASGYGMFSNHNNDR